MKLSISNIAWLGEYDDEIYRFISTNNFSGLEIAPTRLFPHAPYENLIGAKRIANRLKKDYNLAISSMQSIWYGMTESIFGSDDDRQKLVEYTKKAVDFACALNCPNLVFGCPTNRVIKNDMADDYLSLGYDFFNKIGAYAAYCGAFISIEPNPTIYNTNFINTTAQAFELCKKLDNPGIKVNLDVGTLIYNDESIQLKENIELVNHVHISEPYLAPIEKRQLHRDLINELRNLNYEQFLSIEIANPNNIELIKENVLYVKELCHEI